MMQKLKQQVFEANMDSSRYGLMTFIWSNVSAIDRRHGLVVIGPSGADCHTIAVDDMVVVDLYGNVVERRYRPSSGTVTHLALCRHHSSSGGMMHIHSTRTTTWAQAGLAIPTFSTTRTDYLFGDIPYTRTLTEAEVQDEYKLSIGRVVIEMLREVEPLHTSDVVVYQHGLFAWNKDAHDAVHNAVVMEEVAKMTWIVRGTNPALSPIDSYLIDKHFMRRYGPNAYYGQKQE